MSFQKDRKSSAELLEEIKEQANQLVETAKCLRQLSSVEGRYEEIQKLQEKQEQLAENLKTLDLIYSAQKGDTTAVENNGQGSIERDIAEQLKIFHELNQLFIDSLEVKKGLIHLELEEIEIVRKTLKEVSETYDSSSPKRGRKPKVDAKC